MSSSTYHNNSSNTNNNPDSIFNEVWDSLTFDNFIYAKDCNNFLKMVNLKMGTTIISEQILGQVSDFARGKESLKIYKTNFPLFFSDLTGLSLQSLLNSTPSSATLSNASTIADDYQDNSHKQQASTSSISYPKLRSPFPRSSSSNNANNGENSMFNRSHYRRPSGSRISSADSVGSEDSTMSSRHRRTTSLPFFQNINTQNSGGNHTHGSSGLSSPLYNSTDGLKSYTLDKRRISPTSMKKSMEERDLKLKNKIVEQQKYVDLLSSSNEQLVAENKKFKEQYEYLTKEFEFFKQQYSSNNKLSEKLQKQSALINQLQARLGVSSVQRKKHTHLNDTASQGKLSYIRSFFTIRYMFPLVVLLFVSVVALYFLSSSYSPIYRSSYGRFDDLHPDSAMLNGQSKYITHLKWFENYRVLSKAYWVFHDWFVPQYSSSNTTGLNQDFQKLYYERLFDFS